MHGYITETHKNPRACGPQAKTKFRKKRLSAVRDKPSGGRYKAGLTNTSTSKTTIVQVIQRWGYMQFMAVGPTHKYVDF